MRFYDLHVHSAFSEGESSIYQLASRAKELGYSGICFAEYYESKRQISALKKETYAVEGKVGIKILLGFEARNTKELKRLSKQRRVFDILLARGGDMRMNREAVETKEVDILTHPEHGRYDCGMNHIMAKLAKNNNVAIELNFRELLTASKKSRSTVLSGMADNVTLAKKYGIPVILCSGAISHWELKDPLTMISMANMLGFGLKDAKSCITKVPQGILDMVKERRSENWIMPGVKKR